MSRSEEIISVMKKKELVKMFLERFFEEADRHGISITTRNGHGMKVLTKDQVFLRHVDE